MKPGDECVVIDVPEQVAAAVGRVVVLCHRYAPGDPIRSKSGLRVSRIPWPAWETTDGGCYLEHSLRPVQKPSSDASGEQIHSQPVQGAST